MIDEVSPVRMREAARSSAEFADLSARLTVAVRRTAPAWLRGQVEDLVQVAVVRILRRTAATEVNTAFLYRVAHTVVVDEIRKRRRAVILYLQGHSVPEAAELLGFERKKTENLVYRGLDELRNALRDRGFEP